MIIFPIVGGIVLALYGAAWLIAIGYGIASAVWAWQDKRAARQLERDELRQAMAGTDVAAVLALLCTLCRDGGQGRCTCPANCGWDGCTYDHTTFYQLTPLDQEFLRERGIGGGEHQ